MWQMRAENRTDRLCSDPDRTRSKDRRRDVQGLLEGMAREAKSCLESLRDLHIVIERASDETKSLSECRNVLQTNFLNL